MIPLGPVVARSRMNAARATVWAHLTDPGLRLKWWDSLELEPGVGGAVRATGEAGELAGVVDVWVAGHALGFTWNAPGAERGTAVLMTLRSQGYQTGITVTETGFDALADGAARAELAGREWTRFVEALGDASLVEIDERAAGAAGVAGASAAAGVAAGAAADGNAGADSDSASEAGAEVEADAAEAPEAAGAPGAAEADVAASSDTSELELAPLELEGELAVDAGEEPIEVDAEPGLGDHLELVTGPIELPSEDLPSGELPTEDALEDGLVPLVLPEPGEVPLVLPEPPADANEGTDESADESIVEVAAEADVAANDADELEEDDEDEEPDFDSLLRGLL